MRTFSLLLIAIVCCHAPSAHAQDTLTLSCTVCHGAPGEASAVPDFHALSASQLESALRGYRDGTRAGTAMPRLAKALSDAEIAALAQHFGASR